MSIYIVQYGCNINALFAKIHTHTHTHTHTCIYLHLHVYVHLYIYIHKNIICMYMCGLVGANMSEIPIFSTSQPIHLHPEPQTPNPFKQAEKKARQGFVGVTATHASHIWPRFQKSLFRETQNVHGTVQSTLAFELMVLTLHRRTLPLFVFGGDPYRPRLAHLAQVPKISFQKNAKY